MIVWQLRLPMAAMAVAVGYALGASGAVMQTILNNALASAYTLGVSSGAGLGAASVIVLGSPFALPEVWAVPCAACASAACACGLVWLIGSVRGATAEGLVLAGIALMFLLQAMLALLQFIASPEALQQVVFWLFGSLQRATWERLGLVTAVVVVATPLLLRRAWALTALRLGDERAAALRVSVRRMRLHGFLFISLTTGVAVAFTGTFGFVGLVAPHIARGLVGEDQRVLVPGAGLAGVILLAAAPVAGKTVAPGKLFPLGIFTAFVGVPFFAWLILAQRRSYW